MKKKILGLALMCLFASDAYALGNGLQLGGLQINPSITEIESHNDNITRRSTNRISSWLTDTMPALDIIGGSYINYLTLHSYYRYGHYSQHSNYDYHDYYVGLSTHNEASSRAAFDGNVYYKKGHHQVGNFLTGSTTPLLYPTVYKEGAVNATFSYGGAQTISSSAFASTPSAISEIGHLSALLPENVDNRIVVGGGYLARRYENNQPVAQIFNVNQSNANATFYYQVASRIAALIRGSYTNFDYIHQGSPLTNRTLALYTGLSWEITGQTRGIVEVGMQDKKFTDGYHAGPFFSYLAQVEWMPRTYSTVTIESGVRARESTASIALTAPSFVKRYYGAVTWDYLWNSRLSHSISFGKAHNVYLNSGRTDDVMTVGMAVNYLFRPWLSMGVAGDHETLRSNASNVRYVFNRVFFMLSATL